VRKVVVNLTWRCQLQCPYCWVRALGWHTRKGELHWKNWAWWIRRIPKLFVVDFSGGEPLLYPGIVELIEHIQRGRFFWAMTTNLVDMATMERITPRGCGALNVSYHPGSPPDFVGRIERLKQLGFVPRVNVVQHPSVPEVPTGLHPVDRFPYQAFSEGEAVDGIPRRCNAGWEHFVADPLGRVHRCAVWMQKSQLPMGTIAQEVDFLLLPDSLRPCEIGCTTCYTVSPEDWHIRMEPM